MLLSISVTYLAMHLTATPKSSEVEKAEPEFDSGVRLDPSNAQFILFYQTKVDNEIKKIQHELARLKDVSKEMYAIEVSLSLNLSLVIKVLDEKLYGYGTRRSQRNKLQDYASRGSFHSIEKRSCS